MHEFQVPKTEESTRPKQWWEITRPATRGKRYYANVHEYHINPKQCREITRPAARGNKYCANVDEYKIHPEVIRMPWKAWTGNHPRVERYFVSTLLPEIILLLQRHVGPTGAQDFQSPNPKKTTPKTTLFCTHTCTPDEYAPLNLAST